MARGAADAPDRFRIEWRDHAPVVAEPTFSGERWLIAGAGDDLRMALRDPLAALGLTIEWTTLSAPIADAAPPSRLVVVLPPMAFEDGDTASRTGETQAAALLAAMQAVAASPDTSLWVIASGAAGSMPEGLARVFALERPAQWGGLIDLAGDPTAADLDVVRAILVAPRQTPRDSFFQVSRGAASVPRLVPAASSNASEPVFSKDATYLVTGGLGAIGLHLAEWLAAGGAGRVVLVGRRTPSEHALSRLKALEGRSEIVTLAADAASIDDLIGIWPTIAGDAKPLRGVLHAAGVVEPGSLDDLDPGALARLARAKTAGAVQLDDLTRGIPLDFFVLFSSISSVWGTRGLGAYAAANRFLDGLAARRHAAGLPSLSISWGPWSGGGLSDGDRAHELARLGVRPSRPRRHSPRSASRSATTDISSSRASTGRRSCR